MDMLILVRYSVHSWRTSMAVRYAIAYRRVERVNFHIVMVSSCCFLAAWRLSNTHIVSQGRIFSDNHRLVGLVVKASAIRAEDPGFESRFRRDFSGVASYQ